MHKNQLSFRLIFFIILYCFAVYTSLQYHKQFKRFDWKSEIFADKSGYYIYLPATFFYKFRFDDFPQDMREKCGNGFRINPVNQKLWNKYSCGVAILVSPFFIGMHLISQVLGLPEDNGFSQLYYTMTNVAALFYLVAGLWLLSVFLRRYFNQLTTYLTILILFFGTNLYYYSMIDGLMTHVYSFFLFALMLHQTVRFIDTGKRKHFIILSVAFSLALLIRPTNILFGTAVLFLEVNSRETFMKRLRLLFKPLQILLFLVILFLVFLPQMCYWHYLSGRWFYNGYEHESFIYWKSPKLLEVWFAPMNGLFIYVPMFIVLLAGILRMIYLKINGGWYLLLLFLAISYTSASWHAWSFGCSYGQRPYVEYLAILSLPLAYMLQRFISVPKKPALWLLIPVIVAFSYYNVRMSHHYQKCFFGTTWDWIRFKQDVVNAGIIPW